MESKDMNKTRILNRILNNLGINDSNISMRIAENITDLELQTFLLVFPIDGSEPISPKKAQEILKLHSYPQHHGYRNVVSVINSIYNETGIMLNEKNVGLIGLSEDEYEKYYMDVSSFFISRGFSKNKVILKIMRTIPVKDFNCFLEVYEKNSFNETELAEELGVSETFLHTKLSVIKKLIKKEAGIEVFGAKWKKVLIKPIEEYREEVKEYFGELGVDNKTTLEMLSNKINQKDFRVFELRYPLGVEKPCKREVIMETLDISLQMTKKALERIYGVFYENGISFLYMYDEYKKRQEGIKRNIEKSHSL